MSLIVVLTHNEGHQLGFQTTITIVVIVVVVTVVIVLIYYYCY